MQTAVDTYGHLDILVNNAGVFADYQKITETEKKAYDFCYNVNLMGVANGIKYAAPLMRGGGPDSLSIVQRLQLCEWAIHYGRWRYGLRYNREGLCQIGSVITPSFPAKTHLKLVASRS